ncbi:S-adenosyl-L-methionine-dependent methyltransferase [Leucosporidium creatinivorum]|uniref:Protein arginine methyltransferase NDUFAF7 n=1 Tax=Leucosporidium creatinivorum TaxID=106004 RepID=A0A1Y2G680_9BASI|nr:S-adenosyl-L-methionine-dependent methyltransferase [Leucosporidium creatinivorum]
MLSQLRKGSTRALIKGATRSAVPQCCAAARTAPSALRKLSTSSTRLNLASQTPRSTPLTAGKERGTPLVPAELLQVLEETIKTHGPLPVSRYMTLCLAHPTFGYYTTRKVFGSSGDFITSPEISQIFGELLAIWYVTQWAAQGASPRVRIVELGPGRGTLLSDILRTFKSLPKHSSPPVTSIHLVENSEALREEQKKKLQAGGFGDIPVSWWGSVDEVPPTNDEFTVIVAHEFFDALPIHVFENTSNGWREVMVDIADPKAIIIPGKPRKPLRLVLSPSPTPASTLYTRLSTLAEETTPPTPSPSASSALSFDTTLPPAHSPSPAPRAAASASSSSPQQQSISPTLARFARLPEGSRMEISPASWEVARGMGRLLGGERGGAGLVVDYGDAKAFGRSWRGFRKHQVVDPLSEPGHTDLTANVDFSYLAEAMGDLATSHGPLPQSTFLTSLGLQPRLAGLLRAATPERKKEIESAAKRLIDSTGMGSQYKVMAITPKRTEGAPEEECFPFLKEAAEGAAEGAEEKT